MYKMSAALLVYHLVTQPVSLSLCILHFAGVPVLILTLLQWGAPGRLVLVAIVHMPERKTWFPPLSKLLLERALSRKVGTL